MHGRATTWVVATGLAMGTTSLAVAASGTLDGPAQVADRAHRLALTSETTTSDERRLLDETVALVNLERSRRGMSAVRVDDQVVTAAQAHADDMAATRTVRHAGSDGSDGGVRLLRAGYTWSTWGENIAAGFVDPVTLVAAWMSSPGHRANLLGDFADVGVGVAVGDDGAVYWTLLLARRSTP